PCPVLVSGGKVDAEEPGPPCAHLMRDFLIQQGVRKADLIVEDTSRTTFENAVACRHLLEARGLKKVLLVTDALHMPRAAACFRKQGVDLVPGACRYLTANPEFSVFGFLPSPGAARNCQQAMHEWLGAAWYRLRGRL